MKLKEKDRTILIWWLTSRWRKSWSHLNWAKWSSLKSLRKESMRLILNLLKIIWRLKERWLNSKSWKRKNSFRSKISWTFISWSWPTSLSKMMWLCSLWCCWERFMERLILKETVFWESSGRAKSRFSWSLRKLLCSKIILSWRMSLIQIRHR